MKLHELSTDKTYQIDSYGGIAWRYLGPEMEIREDNRYWEDEDGWVWEDEEPEETETGWARMEMIGDDREFIIEPCDISELAEDAYCHECGQIGCGHSTGEATASHAMQSMDLFDAASYPEPTMSDVAGAYEARLNEQFAELGRVTRKLGVEERGYGVTMGEFFGLAPYPER